MAHAHFINTATVQPCIQYTCSLSKRMTVVDGKPV